MHFYLCHKRIFSCTHHLCSHLWVCAIIEQKTAQAGAIAELLKLIWEHKSLYNNADASLLDINNWRAEVNANQPARKRREGKWFLTRRKDLLPGNLSGKDEDWAKWKEDPEDYNEAVRPGARELRRLVATKKVEIRADMVAGEEEWKRRFAIFTLL